MAAFFELSDVHLLYRKFSVYFEFLRVLTVVCFTLSLIRLIKQLFLSTIATTIERYHLKVHIASEMITVALFGEPEIYFALILAYANDTAQSGVVSSGIGRVFLVAGAGFEPATFRL